jgi:hypothetical protein
MKLKKLNYYPNLVTLVVLYILILCSTSSFLSPVMVSTHSLRSKAHYGNRGVEIERRMRERRERGGREEVN